MKLLSFGIIRGSVNTWLLQISFAFRPPNLTMKSASYFLFTAFQLAELFVYAQRWNLNFDHIGTEAGLSQSNLV